MQKRRVGPYEISIGKKFDFSPGLQVGPNFSPLHSEGFNLV
jgi:hypothetical protein